MRIEQHFDLCFGAPENDIADGEVHPIFTTRYVIWISPPAVSSLVALLCFWPVPARLRRYLVMTKKSHTVIPRIHSAALSPLYEVYVITVFFGFRSTVCKPANTADRAYFQGSCRFSPIEVESEPEPNPRSPRPQGSRSRP